MVQKISEEANKCFIASAYQKLFAKYVDTCNSENWLWVLRLIVNTAHDFFWKFLKLPQWLSTRLPPRSNFHIAKALAMHCKVSGACFREHTQFRWSIWSAGFHLKWVPLRIYWTLFWGSTIQSKVIMMGKLSFRGKWLLRNPWVSH